MGKILTKIQILIFLIKKTILNLEFWFPNFVLFYFPNMCVSEIALFQFNFEHFREYFCLSKSRDLKKWYFIIFELAISLPFISSINCAPLKKLAFNPWKLQTDLFGRGCRTTKVVRLWALMIEKLHWKIVCKLSHFRKDNSNK